MQRLEAASAGSGELRSREPGRASLYRRGTVSRLWFITSGGAAFRISSARSIAAAEVGHEDLDLRLRRELARLLRMQSTKWPAPPSRRSSRSTLVITTYFSLQRGDRLGQVERLVGVERIGPAVADVAERAAPRALVAHDHEGRGALAEALADVRARRFLAHRVQVVLAQDLLDLVEARASASRP